MQVGNACPAVLKCAVEDEHGQLLHQAAEQCVLRPLTGFAYNPSAVPAPPSLVAAARGRLGDLRYVATTRVPRNNKPVNCRNPWVHANWTMDRSGTDLLLLDGQLRVLRRAPLGGGRCARSPVALVDARLLTVPDDGGKEQLHVTYSTHGGVPGILERCRGHWLARVHIEFVDAQPRDGAAPTTEVLATVEPSDEVGGAGLSGTPGSPLAAKRNAGLLQARGRLAYELVHTAPRMVFRDPRGARVERAPPRSFSPDLSNSIHPLWVPELGAWLGVAHRHIFASAGRRSPFQFGYYCAARIERGTSLPRTTLLQPPS